MNANQPELPIIALLTDFGDGSHYVAQMKGAIYSIWIESPIVDVTHSIVHQDIHQAAWILSDVVSAFPRGTIFVVVIDPGVGSDRQLVALRDEQQRIFVGPDNGVFSRIVPHGEAAVISLDQPRYWRPQVSTTFHGRDIMAPVAAHLASGVACDQLGSPSRLTRILEFPSPTIEMPAGRIVGRIEYADSFGNLITNIDGQAVQTIAAAGSVSISCSTAREVPLVSCYADGKTGQLVALIGSCGRLEIALVGGSAHVALSEPRHVAVTCFVDSSPNTDHLS